MIVIVQRAMNAYCKTNEYTTENINGLVLFVGITHNDTIEDCVYLAKKIVNLRIFNDSENKMNRSVIDVQGQILSISQFTLYANTKRGNRPSFTDAAEPIFAKSLYHQFNDEIKKHAIKVVEGTFGADMKIALINDGPVTIILNSKEK